MSLASMVLYPSAFLHEQYISLLEYERDAAIGEALPTSHAQLFDEEDFVGQIQSFQLAVRVTSLAHAALQLVVAAIGTLPLLVISTVTVLLHSTHTGFHNFNGGRPERIVLTAFAALAAAWSPVLSSIYTVLDPNDLSDEPFVLSPGVAHAYLCAFTLPSLSEIADRFGHRELLERAVSAYLQQEDPPETIAYDRLKRADIEGYQWREKLAIFTSSRYEEQPAHFGMFYDPFSKTFAEDLQMAVQDALR